MTPELTQAIRAMQDRMQCPNRDGDFYHPPGVQRCKACYEGARYPAPKREPITEDDLRELSRAVAIAVPEWPGVSKNPPLAWYRPNEGDGLPCWWNGEWIEELSDNVWHPAGLGPVAWGQSLAVADAAKLKESAWRWLSENSPAHKDWIEDPCADAALWWVYKCPPEERGPWLSLAVLEAVKS